MVINFFSAERRWREKRNGSAGNCQDKIWICKVTNPGRNEMIAKASDGV
jgi:hypothetical protein